MQGGIKYHFWVFGMTRCEIEPRSFEPLANILPTKHIVRYIYIYIYVYIYTYIHLGLSLFTSLSISLSLSLSLYIYIYIYIYILVCSHIYFYPVQWNTPYTRIRRGKIFSPNEDICWPYVATCNDQSKDPGSWTVLNPATEVLKRLATFHFGPYCAKRGVGKARSSHCTYEIIPIVFFKLLLWQTST